MDMVLALKRMRALDALHGKEILEIEEAYAIVAKALGIEDWEAEDIVESAIEAGALDLEFIPTH